MMLSVQVFVSAENNRTKTVPLKREKREETELPIDPWFQRMPAAPVMCVISETGISIESADSSEIILYEVYDEDGTCLASYPSERDFITYLFQTDKNVELRFHTDNIVYSGWW